MALKVIISGGGTGGHIYPAIAIANALKENEPQTDITFVGAEGKMEMEKVPAAGYSIIGLPVRGLKRSLTLANFVILYKLLLSVFKARKILKRIKPDVVVGVGGYASGPLCYVAAKMKIPVVLQEQNSYPGITNKLLANKADKICVAYEKMERFFPADKIILTGNPVRQDITDISRKRDEGIKFYDLDKDKKTIVIVGGSLGARTINESVLASLDSIRECEDVQVIWQTGGYYYKEMQERANAENYPSVKMTDFLSRMDLAYAVADVIISRAGACTISELCLTAKAAILVPSPNVAEDHQTKNAEALSSKGAAVLVKDSEAVNKLIHSALLLIKDDAQMDSLSQNIINFAQINSAERIAEEIIKTVDK